MTALHFIFAMLIAVSSTAPAPQENSLETTKSQPNPEYVYIQSTGPGSRTISRKDKAEPERPFETAHKLPPSLTFLIKHTEDEKEGKEEASNSETIEQSKKVKRAAPAPAGAIRLDVKKLLEKYKDDLATSTTTPKPTTKTTRRKGRARADQKKSENRRVKKNAEVTTVSSVLTTSKIVPKIEDDDVPLLASGSEKQRSRIQIKKGPNGQEYEYEYVYYYYDEDDEPKDSKDKKASNEEITNAHDGPARNEIVEKTTIASRRRTTEPAKTTVAPEVNEVVPSSSRGRSRHVVQHSEEAVAEDRQPASTRFPPRSRNFNTTPLANEPSSEKPASTSRPRIRRPQKENLEVDNVTDETQGSRGRTRANVKRPSLELVDSDTFNTNYNAAAPQSEQQGGPSFPTDLPAGPVRFLGVTPNESVNLPSPTKEETRKQQFEPAASTASDENLVSEKTKEQTATEETIGAADPMDKVALDLYAISQGNQKLLGEESNQTDGDLDKEEDEDYTTETSTTTTTEPTTTTTTTTTTTPAPTTTTTTTTTTTPAPSTEGSLFGRGRYRGRLGNKKTTSHSSTTEASASEGSSKPKKFGGNRSSFGNRRSGARTSTTASPDEEKISKENVKPVNNGKSNSRGRFGSGNRSRSRTTPSPSEESQDSNNVSPSTSAPRPSRPRPTFNIRGRTRPTPAPATSETSPSDENGATSEASVSTTAKSRRIQPGAHSAVRPLRPGPRLNLANRRIGNHSPTSTSTEASDHENNATGEEEIQKEEDKKEESPEPAAQSETNPINRLRNRNRIQVGTAARPKASASSPVQVRRVNPLLARKRPGQKVEPSTEAPVETESTEASTDVEEEPSETVMVSSTTEQPRGLSKLLAGRRRLAGNHRLSGGN